ncbi:MAG TPA: hypothetical protein VHH36_06060 [Candidatus Thermoplasmatota archaeon]|nr:hypothetical protein [Candidatus Thermoplasmatota archaeon]
MRTLLGLAALVALMPAAAACEGVSPGDEIVTGDSLCTLAFIVANKDGLYFTTAGHCVQDGATVTATGFGDIGVAVFRHLVPDTGQPTDGSPGEDFALVRVDPAVYPKLQPKMCGWDGPTGLFTETPGGGMVRHYGHGLVFGDLGPAGQRREGANLDNDNVAFYWTGAGLPGDSGSGVIHESGLALGVLTHVQASPSTNGGTHLLRGFQLAQDAGFAPLRLVLMGEDPVKVLREMQGGAPSNGTAPATPTSNGTAPSKGPTPPTSGNRTPSNSSANGTAPAGGNLSPADLDGSAPGAVSDERNPTPGPGLALVLVAALVAARRRAT